MTYDRFKQTIMGYLRESGITSEVFFNFDEEKQRYEADIPHERVSFLSRPAGISMTVRFGSGHQAVVPVRE